VLFTLVFVAGLLKKTFSGVLKDTTDQIIADFFEEIANAAL